MAAGGFADLEESVRASIRAAREAPELPHRDRVRGAIIDLVSGVASARSPTAPARNFGIDPTFGAPGGL